MKRQTLWPSEEERLAAGRHGVAIHEAGHAVECWLLEVPIAGVVVVSTGTEFAGRCYHGRSASDSKTMLDWSNEAMRIAVAGGVAIGLLWGVLPTLAYLRVGWPYEAPHVGDVWLQPLVDTVRADLQTNWERVEALAAELQTLGSLTGVEAAAVIGGARRRQSPAPIKSPRPTPSSESADDTAPRRAGSLA